MCVYIYIYIYSDSKLFQQQATGTNYLCTHINHTKTVCVCALGAVTVPPLTADYQAWSSAAINYLHTSWLLRSRSP